MLDAPFTLRCGVTVPNRVALAPLTNTMSHLDGTASPADLAFLSARAEGGFGLVSTCAAAVSEEGQAWKGQLGIYSDAHLDGLCELASRIREGGAVGVVQLHHGGAKAMAVPSLTTVDAEGLRGATSGDLERVTRDFVAAARRAEAAGFDGVEVHGANGYLLTQFLSPALNVREDGYGGDLAGRARLVREVVRAVREAVSPGFAVGVRLSPSDSWARLGLVVAESVQVARWLVEDGVDWIHLSMGDAAGPPVHEPGPPIARTFREALPPEVPVLAAGGIWTRADGARAMGEGVDIVVLGRAAIAHPDWPSASVSPEFSGTRPPWTVSHLHDAAVSDAFVAYLSGMSGMVEGGKPRR